MKKTIKSFGYAVKGILRTFGGERNMRIHLCFAFYVVLAGFVTGLGVLEWAAVLLCMGLVMGMELVNTAIEHICDRITNEQDRHIGAAKDAAAGAVLVCALFSAAVGCAVFFSAGRPKAAWDFFCANPFWAALIFLSLVPALIFVMKAKKSDQVSIRKDFTDDN